MRARASTFAITSLVGATSTLARFSAVHRMYARDDASTFNWTTIEPSTTLNWTSCFDSFQCARLSVPLRYSDPSGDQAAVALVKLPSSLSPNDENHGGPILFNPGGPGGSGVSAVLSMASEFHEILGENFDIIGFDPRGVGQTTPPVSVFTDSVEAGTFFSQLQLDANTSASALGTVFAQHQILGKLAVERAEDVSKTLSTPTVAQDMLSIVKAAGQDKLQYWGISYGSALGATFAAMFPDNVGRLLIDGVTDAELYYQGWLSCNRSSDLLDTDKVLTSIYDACVEAGPNLCPIYENSTALVRARVNTLLDNLRITPIPLFNSSGILSTIVDYATVNNQIMQALSSPYTLGAPLTAALVALEQGNASFIYENSQESVFRSLLLDECSASSEQPFVAGLFEIAGAIGCGDIVTDNMPSFDGIQAAFEEVFAVSPQFSGPWIGTTLCAGWTIRADERFNGSFAQNTSFPLMLIGNVADPITPLASAKKMSELFVNSVLLTQNSSGHTSFAATSTCTSSLIRAYFQNGTLPDAGTVCDIESTIFGTGSSLSQ